MNVSVRKEGSVGLLCSPHPLVGPPAPVARLRLLPIDRVGIEFESETYFNTHLKVAKKSLVGQESDGPVQR